MSGTGYIYADTALCVLSFFAAISTYFGSTDLRRSFMVRLCGVMCGMGWTLLFLRLFSLLTSGGDPHISPISLMALTIVTSFSTIGEISRAADRRVRYGRRKEDRLLA